MLVGTGFLLGVMKMFWNTKQRWWLYTLANVPNAAELCTLVLFCVFYHMRKKQGLAESVKDRNKKTHHLTHMLSPRDTL